MAVAVDAVSSSDLVFTSATSVSGTPITATASATAVVAASVFSGSATVPTSITVKWALQTLSIVTGADSGSHAGTNHTARVFLSAIGSPTTGAQTAQMTWTNSYSGYFNIMSWKGSDTSTPCKNGTSNSGSGNATATITVTSPANDFAVGAMVDDGIALTSANQTSWWLDNSGSTGNGAANYTTGAGSTTLTTTISAFDSWWYAACDVQVPASAFVARPISAGTDRERPPPISRAPDESFGWFLQSQVPVPTSRMVPRTGEDVERLPPIQRAPDEPPGPFFTRSPVPVPTTFYPPTTGADRERIFPIPRSPDEATPFFRRSLIVVPTAYPPQTGADRERLPPIGRSPDEATPFFTRSPAPVPTFLWFTPYDQPPLILRPQVDQVAFIPPPPPAVSTIAGMAWYTPAEQIARSYPGVTDQRWAPAWTPQVIVQVTLATPHFLPFFATPGQMRSF